MPIRVINIAQLSGTKEPALGMEAAVFPGRLVSLSPKVPGAGMLLTQFTPNAGVLPGVEGKLV